MAPKFDLATPKGIGAFNGFISSKSYVEGYSYSQADADMFATCAGVPDKSKAPHAYRWYIHIAAIKGVRSLSLASSSGSAPAAAPASTSRVRKLVTHQTTNSPDFPNFLQAAPAAATPAAKPAEKSRAEKMAEAKAAKDAKKKVDRSQIVFEVKPWDTETDLKDLFGKIRETVIPGLVWGEAHKLVPVAFGVKKLVLSCVVEDDKVGVEDITDVIEAFEDYVQSVDMTTMNRL
ncbi:unnamed protein product [Scytosiphon promiscuus]